MSRNAAFSHVVPFKIWVSTIVVLLFPILFDTSITIYSSELGHDLIEMAWFVYILPPITFAFSFGLKRAILLSFILQIIHSFYEAVKHAGTDFLIDDMYFIFTQLSLSVIISYMVGVSTEKLKQEQTELEMAYKNIEQLAYYDSLTSLPNRRMFLQRLDAEIAQHKQNETQFALLFIDLDGFKEVNDTWGHKAGDLLLQEVSRRFMTCVRRGDCLARFAGDEFTVLLSNITQADAIEVAERLLRALQPIFMIQNQAVGVTASIGMGLYPDHGETSEALLRYTDEAMYEVKRQGKNNYHLHIQKA